MNWKYFIYLLILFLSFSCASQKTMVSEEIEEGDAAELLSNMTAESKAKENVFNENEISNMVAKFDSMCDKKIIVSKIRNLEKLTRKIERTSHLDSVLLDYAIETNNNRLATSLRELKFRTLVKTQERMEEAFKGKGKLKTEEVHGGWKFDKPISKMIPYVQANQQYSKKKSKLLFETIESLSQIEDKKEKKRCWIAIDRMINEIDIKNSETGYRPFQRSARGIVTHKGKVVEAIKNQIKKESDLEIIELSNNLFKKIDREIVKTDDEKTKAQLQIAKELDREFKKQMGQIPDSDISDGGYGLSSSDWFDKGYFTEDDNLKIVFYTKATEMNPDYAAAFNNRGNAYQKLGKANKAISDYSQTIVLQKNYAPAYLNRGNIFQDNGEFEKAIKDYSEAIKLDPKNKMAFNFRANCYKNMSDFAAAINDYNRAIELDSKYFMAFLDRGDAYRNSNQDKEAIKDYNRAIELKPNLAQGFNNRGMSYKKLGKFQESIKDYEKAIEINPNYAQAFYNLGCTYWDLKDWNAVIEAWEKCLELDPDNENAVSWLRKAKGKAKLEEYRKQLENEKRQ